MTVWTKEREFIDPITELEWETEGVQPPGASEAISYRDNNTGSYIRLVYSKPGVGIGLKEPFAHDFDEFVYIISGGLYNKRLNCRYEAGIIGKMPHGVAHGPLEAPVGAYVIEFRNVFKNNE